MSRTKEMREVEVRYCDFCKKEVPESHLSRCVICGREMCNEGGGAEHTAYSLDIFRYEDRARANNARTKICKDCANKPVLTADPDTTVKEFLDNLIVGK